MVESHKKRRLSGASTTEQAEVKIEDTTTTADVPTQPQARRTLFVRSLPVSATTESLAEHFSQSYVIKHAVVVSDPKTKISKGFGFVTFADLEDAESALKELDGSKFDGKIIRVDYAESRKREIDEKVGRSVPTAASVESKHKREEERGQGAPPKLIVRNLPWTIKEPEDLSVLFRSFGKVKHATLPKKNGKLAGFGFVILRGKKNAEKALQNVNGKEIDGRTLAVDWAVEKDVWETTKKEDEEEEPKEEKEDVEMEDADGHLEEPSDDETSSDGSDDDEEDNDLDELDELDEDAEDKDDDRNNSTIFLRNLPFTATDDSLYEHFAQFGPLRYARVVLDHETERPRGTGFVCFWKVDDANTCIREAPRANDVMAPNKDKPKSNTAMKHSVLQDENNDPSGRYTLEGRVLQVARAVSKGQAAKLEEEGVSRRLVRDTDKRRLYLLGEGTIATNSPLYKKLSPSEVKMREESFKQRETFIKKNPALHLSLTRLAIRNIPRHINSKDLKQLARESVVNFAKDVKKGVRQPLSREEQQRSRDTMKELEQLRKQKKMGIVRQAKVVFETREGTKVSEKSGGGRSRGYGFIEYFTHRHALMGLRWLNCHAIQVPESAQNEDKDKKKRLVVEFAIENAQVVKRRNELQAKSREPKPKKSDDADEGKDSDKNSKKRKRSDSRGKEKDGKGGNAKDADDNDDEEENKIAKRNRIISKKRMQRKSRKGK